MLTAVFMSEGCGRGIVLKWAHCVLIHQTHVAQSFACSRELFLRLRLTSSHVVSRWSCGMYAFCNAWHNKGVVFCKDKTPAHTSGYTKQSCDLPNPIPHVLYSFSVYFTRWWGAKLWPIVGWFCSVCGCVSSQCLSVWTRPKKSLMKSWSHHRVLWVT